MSVVALVQHRVADFDAWKAVYDSVRDVQKANGVRAHHVWRSRQDPNLVLVEHLFDTENAAHAFFDMGELREAMIRGGVDPAAMTLTFLDDVEGGRL